MSDRGNADGLIWAAFFLLLGVLIVVNLPDPPALVEVWFLIGASSIALGILGLITYLYGGRRGR